MTVLVEGLITVKPLTGTVFDEYVEIYGSTMVPAATRSGFDLLGAWKRTGGPMGQIVVLFRFDEFAAIGKAYETLRSESGLLDALTKFVEHAQFSETLKIAEPVPYATPERLNSALTETPDLPRQYVQGVIDMKPGSQALIYDLVGRLADMGDAGQWAQMVTAYETLIGRRPELTDLWIVPNEAVSGFNSYVSGDPVPDISTPLREIAPDESLYYLNPLPFSPLQ